MKTIAAIAAIISIFAFANLSEAGTGNIPIAPFQIALGIAQAAQAIQSTQQPIYKSKEVKPAASKKKQTASRSSRRPPLAAASNQSSAVVSTPAEPSHAAGASSEQFAGLPSSKTVSESAAPSESTVGNVNESATQAASIAAASTPAASSNAAEMATTALDSAPAATPPPSEISWKEVNAIYNLQSNYTNLQKEEAWKRYKGQRVMWIGKVEGIDKGWLGGLHLQVKMNRDTFTFDLAIDLKKSEEAKAMSIHKGDIIRFTGILDTWGSLLPISISDGEIISQ
jgi:hypothetical protein